MLFPATKQTTGELTYKTTATTRARAVSTVTVRARAAGKERGCDAAETAGSVAGLLITHQHVDRHALHHRQSCV